MKNFHVKGDINDNFVIPDQNASGIIGMVSVGSRKTQSGRSVRRYELVIESESTMGSAAYRGIRMVSLDMFFYLQV